MQEKFQFNKLHDTSGFTLTSLKAVSCGYDKEFVTSETECGKLNRQNLLGAQSPGGVSLFQYFDKKHCFTMSKEADSNGSVCLVGMCTDDDCKEDGEVFKPELCVSSSSDKIKLGRSERLIPKKVICKGISGFIIFIGFGFICIISPLSLLQQEH